MAGYPVDSTACEALVDRPDHRADRCREADAPHRLAELRAVLGDPDGALVGADEFDTVALQRAVAHQCHRHVQRGLAAHRRQQGVGPLALDHPRHPLRRDRLDVGPVGEFRVGHDGGGVGVHQDDPVALLLQRPHRLGSGVVELGALPDDDRAPTR